MNARQHWPLVALAIAGGLAYWDLKSELRDFRHETRLARAAQPSVAAPAPAAAPRNARRPGPAAQPTPAPTVPPHWECAGTIARQALIDRSGGYASEFFACAEQAHPGRGGTFTVALRVAGDGSVAETHASGTIAGYVPLADCVLGAAESWTLPRPEGGDCAIVTLPFALPAAKKPD